MGLRKSAGGSSACLVWANRDSLAEVAVTEDCSTSSSLLSKENGELHALSVHQECCKLLPGNAGVILRPNPAFFPKASSRYSFCDIIITRRVGWGGYLSPTQGWGLARTRNHLLPGTQYSNLGFMVQCWLLYFLHMGVSANTLILKINKSAWGEVILIRFWDWSRIPFGSIIIIKEILFPSILFTAVNCS